MYDSHLEQLPPELLEKIFKAFVADVKQLKHIAQTCSKFHFVVLKIHPVVSIPLEEEQLLWLKSTQCPLYAITNREIAAYVIDQILPLNLGSLKTARLVSFDYQSRRCEVTPHYWQLLLHISRCGYQTLRRLEVNADLAQGFTTFRFAELISSFKHLQKLSIHFSAHIELNQRILHSTDAQKLLNIVLAELVHLRVLNIYTFPPVQIHLHSASLTEFGLFKSELTRIVTLNTPALRKLSVEENFKKLILSNIFERNQYTHNKSVHRNLFSLLHASCPHIELINRRRFPSQWEEGEQVSRSKWIGLIKDKFLTHSVNAPSSRAHGVHPPSH